jgi:chaperonin GroES
MERSCFIVEENQSFIGFINEISSPFQKFLKRRDISLPFRGNTMTITPVGERVVLQPEEKKEKTKGGIYIPEAAKEERKAGTIISVGSYKDGKELPLKSGDRVLYGGYSAETVTVDGKEYVFVEFKDILAVLG